MKTIGTLVRTINPGSLAVVQTMSNEKYFLLCHEVQPSDPPMDF